LKRKKAIIIIAAIVIVCGSGAYYAYDKLWSKKQTAGPAKEVSFTVKKGNLRTTISGTAQLEPQELQMIVPPKEGMIKTINMSRNMQVKKGDLLLELSDSAMEEKLDQSTLDLDQMQSDLQELQKEAASLQTIIPVTGKLVLSTNISEGTNVSKTTKLATIADTSKLSVILPFLQEETINVKVGDTVKLVVDGFMLSKAAAVESVSASPKADSKGNRQSDIKVRVENDGTLDAGLMAKGTLIIGNQQVESKASAALQYYSNTTILAGVSGTISRMEIKSDQMVTKGQLLSVIESDSLQRDITQKKSQIEKQLKSIADLQTQLSKLKVYAPFDGVFSTDFADQKKNVLNAYPVGTTVKSSDQFGAVASLDTLQLPIRVDELDLPRIKTGMKAEVKVDAIPGKLFPGEVAQVSTVGTTTNGVTFYSVVLTLKNAAELKYAMTATADILIEDKRNVLLLPVEALQSRQGKRYVSLKKEDGTVEADHEVKVGVNNSTMVEITDGLKEGDQIVIPQSRSQRKLSPQEVDQARQQFQNVPGGGAAPRGPGGGR
jgi:HlyD family secretion protein